MSEYNDIEYPRIQIQSLSYDGPGVFLQGENGIIMNIEGKVVSNISLHPPRFYIELFGTFMDRVNEQGLVVYVDTHMVRIGEPTVALFSVNSNPDEHVYTFKASYRSVFNTLNYGRCDLRANFQFAPFECAVITDLTIRHVVVISVAAQNENRARHQGHFAALPEDFDHDGALGDQGPGVYVGPGGQSSLMIEPPISPISQREGDQGAGELIGRGEDANWSERSLSPAPSNLSTIPNTEADDDYSIPDTASQSRLSPERDT